MISKRNTPVALLKLAGLDPDKKLSIEEFAKEMAMNVSDFEVVVIDSGRSYKTIVRDTSRLFKKIKKGRKIKKGEKYVR